MNPLTSKILVVAALLALASSCASDDDGSDECVGEIGCNGECELGNSYGVGRYCTLGGGECNGELAIFCTVDFQETTETYCTRPCDPDADVDEQCGEETVCRGEEIGGTGPSGCVPILCQ